MLRIRQRNLHFVAVHLTVVLTSNTTYHFSGSHVFTIHSLFTSLFLFVLTCNACVFHSMMLFALVRLIRVSSSFRNGTPLAAHAVRESSTEPESVRVCLVELGSKCPKSLLLIRQCTSPGSVGTPFPGPRLVLRLVTCPHTFPMLRQTRLLRKSTCSNCSGFMTTTKQTNNSTTDVEPAPDSSNGSIHTIVVAIQH